MSGSQVNRSRGDEKVLRSRNPFPRGIAFHARDQIAELRVVAGKDSEGWAPSVVGELKRRFEATGGYRSQSRACTQMGARFDETLRRPKTPAAKPSNLRSRPIRRRSRLIA
jgi:hypothetical protein